MSLPPESRALLLALGAVVLWSTVASGFKLGLRVLTPVQLLWLGVVCSTLFFLAMSLRERQPWPTRLEWQEAALFGLVNPVLYYLVLFAAYDRLPAQIAQPLNYTWAITLAVLAMPLLKQPLTGRGIAGILVSYVGVVVLLTGAHTGSTEPLDPLGIGLALLSTILWAGYWLLNARSALAPLRLLTLSFCCALPLLTLLCALTDGLPAFTRAHFRYGAWVGLIEMGITFMLWQSALRLTSQVALIGQLIYLSPFLSLLLIQRLVGESIHATSYWGLAIIVGGLALSGRPTPPPD